MVDLFQQTQHNSTRNKPILIDLQDVTDLNKVSIAESCPIPEAVLARASITRPQRIARGDLGLLLVLELAVHTQLDRCLLLPDDSAIADLDPILLVVVTVFASKWYNSQSRHSTLVTL